MKKATYKGQISQDVKNFDLANINVYDWFSQFPKNIATAKESGLVEKLTSVIKSNDAEKNYTFSDDRFVLIATNLIRLVPKEKYNFTISEYLIFYRYIQVKYDENIQGIDNLIEFVNQMIGFSAEGGSISDEQKEILSETAESIDLEALRMCPLFIAEDIENAMKEDVEEVDMAGVEVLEKPEGKDLISEMEDEEEMEEIEEILRMTDSEELELEPVDEGEETEGEPAEVAEWRETIAALQELIMENDSPESNAEWQETIDALKELIADSGYKFGRGGKTPKKSKGGIGKSGEQYGYTLEEWEEIAKKKGLLVSPKEWWKSQQGKTYKDFAGRTKKIGDYASDEQNSMNEYGYLIANGLDLGSKIVPPSAKKYVEENNFSKFNDNNEADEIKSEIEKQEKKLGLAALPESAKDAIRKKIEQLKSQLETQKEKPKEEAKEEKSYMSDADIRAEIDKQEKKLGLAALPESAKDAIRKKIAQLKGQLGEEEKPAETKKKKIISTRKEKKKPIEKKPVSKPKEKVIEKLEEIEEEEEEVVMPKKRGRKPKAKVEPAEPKVPKKRGRKPKPKAEPAEPKVPQKRGRKPKPKLSLSDFGFGTKFNINDFI
jgi:hypothetical protein